MVIHSPTDLIHAPLPKAGLGWDIWDGAVPTGGKTLGNALWDRGESSRSCRAEFGFSCEGEMELIPIKLRVLQGVGRGCFGVTRHCPGALPCLGDTNLGKR